MQMTVRRHRTIPVRVASYLVIYASALIGLALLMLILEQLGARAEIVQRVLIFGPLILYFLIALLAYAVEPIEYFAASRGVAPFVNGLANSVTALGGVGLVSVTGLFFFLGYDAFAFAIGWMLGLMVLAILLAPYLRKYGALTVSGYLGRRFASPTIRFVSAVLLMIPITLVLVAELELASHLVTQFTGLAAGRAVALLTVAIFCMVSIGGMYGLTLSNCAQAIAIFCGVMTPLVIVSLRLTNLPFPQLTYGLLLERLGFREASNTLSFDSAATAAQGLPGIEPAQLTKPFLSAFEAFGSAQFVMIALVLMAGIASMPALLVRSGTTRSVYDMRKSMGWTVFLVGLLLLSMPAVAVFFRFTLLDSTIGIAIADVPDWFRDLVRLGIVTVESGARSLTLENVAFARDGILTAFALSSELPLSLFYLGISGALAATVAAVTAQTLTLANLITDDLIFGSRKTPPGDTMHMTVARAAVAISIVVAGIFVLEVKIDPLLVFLWGTSIGASTIFPVLIMSIWWKRITGFGAFVGMVTGFGSAVLYLTMQQSGLMPPLFGITDAFAGAIGIPVGAIAAVIASLTSPAPRQALLEFVKDLRIPGGETIYDRELRIATNKSRPR